MKQRKAFSIIELLIAICVIGVLSTLTVVAVSKFRVHAETTRSTLAVRSLTTATHLYSSENDGRLFPAYDTSVSSAFYQGRNIDSTSSHRYPYRLAPYFNDDFAGTVWVGENYEQLSSTQMFKNGMSDYAISMFPAFGLNQQMVGGRVTDAYGTQDSSTVGEAATTLSDLSHPLILFASAGQRAVNFGVTKHKMISGYFLITPPYSRTTPNWNGSSWKNGSDPAYYGNLDARADGKVVVSFTDGSVRLMEVKDMSDMRLWSRNAAQLNEPDYNPRTAKNLGN